MKDVMEKEDQTNLKTVRLRQLEQASHSIAHGFEAQCFEYLQNFMASIEDDTEAAGLILKDYNQMKSRIKNEDKLLFKYIRDNNLGYLEQNDYLNYSRPMIRSQALREFCNDCWSIALRFNLIPKE